MNYTKDTPFATMIDEINCDGMYERAGAVASLKWLVPTAFLQRITETTSVGEIHSAVKKLIEVFKQPDMPKLNGIDCSLLEQISKLEDIGRIHSIAHQMLSEEQRSKV